MSKKHEARTEREKADLKEFHEAMEETKTNFKKLLINKDTVWPGMLAVDEVNAKAARLGLGPIMKEGRYEDEPNHPLGPLQGQHIRFLAPDERDPATLSLTWLLDPGDILQPKLIEPLLKPGTTRDVIECLQAWQDKEPLPPELRDSVDATQRVAGGLPRQEGTQIADDEPVLTELQIRILEELKDTSWTAEGLTKHLESIAMGRDVRTVKKALRGLKTAGKVANRRGLGYYRPDFPPKPVEG